MVTEFSHLQVADLTKEEHDAALECGTQLDTLRFRPQDDYEVCDDNEGLEIASRTFIEKFAPWSKVSHSLFPEYATYLQTKYRDKPVRRQRLQAQSFSFPEVCNTPCTWADALDTYYDFWKAHDNRISSGFWKIRAAQQGRVNRARSYLPRVQGQLDSGITCARVRRNMYSVVPYSEGGCMVWRCEILTRGRNFDAIIPVVK